MQWLTAILAFATTMLVFAIIVSTIVETIHRIVGSRTYGLIMMLEHFYIDVLEPHIEDKGAGKEKFVEDMVKIRGSAVPIKSVENSNFIVKYIGWFAGLVPRFVKFLYNKLTNTGNLAIKLGKSQWQLLTDIPVVTFMERLADTPFADCLPDKEKEKDSRNAILKDIAQKYENYGYESAIYFERKARSISVIVAFFVAWTFYVHPQNLIQTYLKNPDVAAKVAEMSDDTLANYAAVEKRLAELGKSTDQTSGKLTKEQYIILRNEISENLAKGRENSQLLVDAGAPIGWPADADVVCLYKEPVTVTLNGTTNKSYSLRFGQGDRCKNSIVGLNVPGNKIDTFWLLMGGLLIGLGAPFWMKAIGQIKQTQGALDSVTKILKPNQATKQGGGKVNINVEGNKDDQPVTTEAFEVANAARAVTS